MLVGFDSSDDAAVYRLDETRCLLSTIDFFPPNVSDAAAFGRIAAANAFSDIYAMGGRPLYALNIVCYPRDLNHDLLRDILAGGMEKCAEAGAFLAGGHSIYDSEIKYGLAVTGIAENGRFYRNNTLRVGDKLILTKPLGTGIITAAERDGEADGSDYALTVTSMERLNKYAAEKLPGYDVSACTDVTGFGLLVHALEMTAGSFTIELIGDSLPCLPNARRYIEDGFLTGGGQRNRQYAGERADVKKLPEWMRELVFDPQTSGGLLVAVREDQADGLLADIRVDDPYAAIIGGVIERGSSEIVFH